MASIRREEFQFNVIIQQCATYNARSNICDIHDFHKAIIKMKSVWCVACVYVCKCLFENMCTQIMKCSRPHIGKLMLLLFQFYMFIKNWITVFSFRSINFLSFFLSASFRRKWWCYMPIQFITDSSFLCFISALAFMEFDGLFSVSSNGNGKR